MTTTTMAVTQSAKCILIAERVIIKSYIIIVLLLLLKRYDYYLFPKKYVNNMLSIIKIICTHNLTY